MFAPILGRWVDLRMLLGVAFHKVLGMFHIYRKVVFNAVIWCNYWIVVMKGEGKGIVCWEFLDDFRHEKSD